MSLVLTRMQNMRANSANLDKYETRPSRYGALDLFMQQSQSQNGIISPELIDKAQKSIGRVLESPVIDYDSGVTISNTRSITIPDALNTSRMIQYTFVTYSWGFTVVPSNHMNNEIDVQREFDNQMKKHLYKFAEMVDEQCVAALNAAKSKVYNDLLSLYTNYADTVTAKYSQKEEILGDLEPIMNANDFYEPMHVLGNTGVRSLLNKLSEYGLYNEKDKQYQYQDKVWHFTNRVINGAGKYATGYVIQDGAIGMLLRYEREAFLRRKTFNHEWDIVTLPVVNMPVGSYYYGGVSDESATYGAATADNTRAWKEHYGFSVDISFVTSYNSDPDNLESPIAKIAVNTAATDADVTAPTVDSITSAAKTLLTVNFDDVMCSDEAGTIATGDIVDDLAVTGDHGTLLSAVWNATGTAIVITFSSDVGLVATDKVSLDGVFLYDANANKLASQDLAQVNAGATAWEAIP